MRTRLLQDLQKKTIRFKSIVALTCLLLTSVSAFAQTKTVTGTVTDAANEPLIGASVLVQGTSTGTITDMDGKYSISVTPENVLVFSYVGMTTQSVKVGAQNVINVTLKEDSQVLAETVVIGYGSAKKRDLTGSITNVKGEEIANKPATNPLSSLQGKVAGVQIVNSGRAGADPEIRIRGTNSINGYKPLYVVDGLFNDNINFLNPEDIESMEILKDPSSLAIFGVRGANGVIIITTKKAKEGQTLVNINTSFGFKKVVDKVDLVNGPQFQELYSEQLANQKDTPFDFSGWNANTNWQDEIFRTGITQNYKLALSNGSEKTQYYISANYMSQEGVVIESKNERYQAKANLSSQLTDWLHITADINASHGVRRGGSFASGKDNPIWIALNYSPTMTMMAENGNYNTDTYNSIASNPVGILKLQSGETMTNVFNGRVDLRLDIMKGLTFTTTNGVDYYDGKSYSFSSKRVGTKSGMGNNDTYRLMLQSSNNLTYTGSWNDHHLTATAVYEVTSSETRTMGITGNNLLTEGVGWWNVGMASSRDANNGYEQWALMSGVARVMYNFKDRYMLTGTFRADGSSRFAKKKWGYFPSIAAAWTLSNEDFMKDVSSVQDIKLRASYGIVGSQAISPYATMGLMSATAYNFGTNSNFTGYWANDIATPELTWEKTKQFDLGLEFSLFDRRLNFSVDYFYKRTTDALLKRSIPGYVGGNSFWVNDGEISNRGIDLSVTARIMQNDRFQWTSTLNGTYLKNRVERLSGGENDFINGSSPAAGMVDYATIIKPGEAIGTFWGYEWTGLDENGHDTYTDVDGNQMIDGGDRKVIGKANPDFTLGWNNSLSYKNWDLNLFFNGSFGAKRLNLVRYTMASAEGNSRFVTLADAYLKGFDKIGSSATYPSLTEGGNNLQPVSTKWLENADFLRLENISLSYTFPKKTTGFADLRLTFSCQNLFTITGYKGMDPAGTTFSNSSVDVDAGIDMGAYPSPRTFTFGLRMNF